MLKKWTFFKVSTPVRSQRQYKEIILYGTLRAVTTRVSLSSHLVELSFDSIEYMSDSLPRMGKFSCSTLWPQLSMWFLGKVPLTRNFKKYFLQVFLFLQKHLIFWNSYFEIYKDTTNMQLLRENFKNKIWPLCFRNKIFEATVVLKSINSLENNFQFKYVTCLLIVSVLSMWNILKNGKIVIGFRNSSNFWLLNKRVNNFLNLSISKLLRDCISAEIFFIKLIIEFQKEHELKQYNNVCTKPNLYSN